MRIPKLASVFLLVLCLIIYLTYVKKHIDILTPSDSKDLIQSRNGKDELCHSEVGDLNKSNFLYGIMFDAGSTGTRIHVFKFNKTPNEAPKLAHETFKAIKPGLSPYADDPEKCTAGIKELLNVAKEIVPCDLWKSTPLVLKATAGLRLLPGEKAKQLLDKVKDIFQASPFLSREDCVGIMDGSDEDSKDLIQSRNGKDELCHSEVGDLNKSNFLYGIMFDAGSTGTRIHVFKFNKTPNEAPKLAHETFKAIKPGLSPYADDPEKCTAGIKELLNVAKEIVPCDLWKSTPLVLKATAGLRLLPGEKAKQLLDKVKDIFQASPFLSREDCVGIMDGSDEGSLHGLEQNTVGMLDLGGGSTQITFSPQDEKTIQTSPIDYITSFQMFSSTFSLYSHRDTILILHVLTVEEGKTLLSPCLAPDYEEQWEHAEVVYTIKGQKAGEPIYESCYSKVEKMLYRKVKKAEEVKDMDFYAFSYYYDRAVDIGVIDEETGGNVKVEDYEAAARKVCKSMETDQGENPFLCLDLTYIAALLQELGFPKDKVLKYNWPLE
ncbi:UNVERIFIED_CONTAM: hypothetical protein FKN15_025041 [Acipenser sinensis]